MNGLYKREKYNYDMTRYVELPNYNDYVIEVDFNALSDIIEDLKKYAGDESLQYDDKFVEKYFEFSTVAEFEEEWAQGVARKQFFVYIKNNIKVISYPEKEYQKIAQETAEASNKLKASHNFDYEKYLKEEMGITVSEYIQDKMKDQMMLVAIADKEGIKPTAKMVKNEREKFISDISAHYLEEHGLTEEEAKSRAEAELEHMGGSYCLYEGLLSDMIASSVIKYKKKS